MTLELTLEEAIEHCKKEAETQRRKVPMYKQVGLYYAASACVECAAEQEQIAEWLIELKQRREADIIEKPRTNGDRIRKMTDDELSKFMCLVKDKLCFGCSFSHVDECEGISCEEARKRWLAKEVDVVETD